MSHRSFTDDRSNYRPISVLPALSRIFEKLIFNQLYKYLDTNKHLFPKQSGFRRLYSVVTSLLSCTNDWYKNMDTGKYTALVFIDLKKAFDTVDHDILLKKMQKYGVSGNELPGLRHISKTDGSYARSMVFLHERKIYTVVYLRDLVLDPSSL